jgi:DNA-directed RNA polymerase specialized sigma24 family protein
MSLDAKHGTSRGPFEPTRWSLVLRAGAEDTAQRNAALGELYGAYWSPLYAFLRRGGRTVDDARDLVQEFFVRLLDGSLLSAADPAKGRFRTLLLAGLRHLDANTHRAALAAKRGGGRELVPLDFVPAEERWQAEASRSESPEQAFDRAWANVVIDRASVNLREDYQASGKGPLFEALFPCLLGNRPQGGLVAVGERLGMSEGGVKMALSRLRHRFGEALQREIAHTVGSRADVQEELRYLLSVLV